VGDAAPRESGAHLVVEKKSNTRPNLRNAILFHSQLLTLDQDKGVTLERGILVPQQVVTIAQVRGDGTEYTRQVTTERRVDKKAWIRSNDRSQGVVPSGS
jgi:hypothetical protein